MSALGKSLRPRAFIIAGTLLFSAGVTGCADHRPPPAPLPVVAPDTQPAGPVLALDGERAAPMYRELLTVDLPAVVRVAQAQNLDIRQARLAVQAARGRYERSFGAIFPVISPGIAFDAVDGTVRAVNGPLIGADFTSFSPAVLLQWALNPGRVYYDIVASRKRLDAAEQQERGVQQETLRLAVNGYYDLVLSQARLAVARRSVAESEELLRITKLRLGAGTGLEADLRRAEADLARRRQVLALALNQFYNASVGLALTLHLDPSVTLLPQPRQVPQVTLVAENMEIDRMLGLALAWRQDLAGVRKLVEAANADRGAIDWGAFGPGLQVGYSYGGISSDTSDQNFSLHQQQRLNATAGWSFSFSAIGDMKTADALQKQAAIEAERTMDKVKAQVVRVAQASLTSHSLIPMSQQQLEANEAALSLAQANLKAGTMLTLDVLQAEDAVDEARLRYADAVVTFNRSQVDLLASLGLIDAKAILAGESSAAENAPTTAPGAATSPAAGN